MAEPVVRPCTPADIEQVEQLRLAGWQTAYRGIVPDSFLDAMVPNAGRRGRTAQAQPDVLEGVAVCDLAVVGWVVAGPCRDDDRGHPHQGEIFACYVLPPQWRSGIGRLLMSHAMAWLAAAGRDDVSLWVLAANTRARRFYESCGFRPDGTRKLIELGELVPEVRYWRPGQN
jgi:ribosomal protein S18 acetylase RimI-like enzyme